MDNVQKRLEIEDKIKDAAQMIRAQAEVTAASVRTSPEVLVKACTKLCRLADDIRGLAASVEYLARTFK